MTYASIGIDPNGLIRAFGTLGLFAVVFAESGILLGFFLPGDSLLFTAGLLAATTNLLPALPILMIGCSIAAVMGDQVGYVIGGRLGPRVAERPDGRLVRADHLRRAEDFFARHGSKTIVIARFVPVVRTFTPVVAGASQMHYRRFVAFNVIGGIGWACGILLLGWVLGSSFPGIGDYLDVAIVAIVVLSLVPVGLHALRERRGAGGGSSPN